jgi:Uma2 family endonuclease
VELSDYRSSKKQRPDFKYRAKPKPITFPKSLGEPESRRHYELRSTLFQVAKAALANRAAIGSAQLVYWNAANPTCCVDPDLFVRVGAVDSLFESWKTWERGAPDVAVEIVGNTNATELAWDQSLRFYHELGIEELVRFDPIAPVDCLRVWDRVQDDLVERDLDGRIRVESLVLGLFWVVHNDATLGPTLRLAKDDSGGRLLPTPAEWEAKKRKEAEARVRELEEQIRRMSK